MKFSKRVIMYIDLPREWLTICSSRLTERVLEWGMAEWSGCVLGIYESFNS